MLIVETRSADFCAVYFASQLIHCWSIKSWNCNSLQCVNLSTAVGVEFQSAILWLISVEPSDQVQFVFSFFNQVQVGSESFNNKWELSFNLQTLILCLNQLTYLHNSYFTTQRLICASILKATANYVNKLQYECKACYSTQNKCELCLKPSVLLRITT